MKQGVFRGFGAPYLTGAKPPERMPDEVVTLCVASENPEASAIRNSILYAKRAFGYRQLDIAKLCGWKSDNHLSAYAGGFAQMPEKRHARFQQVTGCALLEQVRDRLGLAMQLNGRPTANDLDRAIQARMRAAA